MEHAIERFNSERGRTVTSVSQKAMAALMQYHWPGNVRELENAIEHAFVLCRDDIIRIEDLPERLISSSQPMSLPAGQTLKDIEKTVILQTLKRYEGRKVAAARELGIDKNTLRRKMIRFGIRLDANQKGN